MLIFIDFLIRVEGCPGVLRAVPVVYKKTGNGPEDRAPTNILYALTAGRVQPFLA
jgi:hypothetical protein